MPTIQPSRDAGQAEQPIRNAPIRPLPALLAGAGVLASAMALLLVAGFVVDHRPFSFDRAIILGMRGWGGPHWLGLVTEQVTALGSVPVLALVVLAAAGLLGVAGRWLTALAMVAGTAGGGLAVTLLKHEVARPRPEIVPHLVVADGLSFPSGHAAGSAIVYLTLAALTTQVVRPAAVRRYLLAVATALVTMIGASRVYLGVHWPSDVLAGWCFGALWAWGCWLATSGLRGELAR